MDGQSLRPAHHHTGRLDFRRLGYDTEAMVCPGKGVRVCVGGATSEKVCCRRRMTSERLPSRRPLYLQVRKEADTERFGQGNWRTIKGQSDAPAHMGDLNCAS